MITILQIGKHTIWKHNDRNYKVVNMTKEAEGHMVTYTFTVDARPYANSN